MKKIVSLSFVLMLGISVFAQDFENIFGGYKYPLSVYADDTLIFEGCTNLINVFRNDGTFVGSHYVPGSVYSITKDTSGNIVCGVYDNETGCLAIFNGQEWSHFKHDDGLPQGEIVSLAYDHNNNIWICMSNPARIVKYDGINWTEIYGFGDTITIDHTNKIVVDNSNTVFIGITVSGGTSWNYGVVAINNNDTVIYNYLNSNFQVGCRHSSFLDSNNHVWFGGCYNSLYRFDGTTWHKEAQNEVFNANNSYCAISQNTNGDMVLATGLKLYIGSGNNWLQYGIDDGLQFNSIVDADCDMQGFLWVISSNNNISDDPRIGCLSRLNDGVFEHFFPNSYIGIPRNILFNGNRAYTYGFAGSPAPLSVFDGETWDIEKFGDGFYNKNTNAVAIDSDGNIWLGADSLYCINTLNQKQGIDSLCGDSLGRVNCLAVSGDKIWLSDSLSRLYEYNGSEWNNLNVPENISLKWATRLLVGDENDLWFVTGGKAYRYQSGNWTDLNTSYGFPTAEVINDITFAGDSTWFATRHGLALMYNNELHFICNDSTYSSGYSDYYTVYADRNGKIWAGNRKCAVSILGDQPEYIYPGGVEQAIYTIREDNSYKLWFCGSLSLSSLHYSLEAIEPFSRLKENLQLYPNPATDEFFVELPQWIDNDVLEIYSPNGSLVWLQTIDFGINRVDICGLKPGMYLVKLTNANAFGKVVVE